MLGHSISHWGVFFSDDNMLSTNVLFYHQDGHIEKLVDAEPMRWCSGEIAWPSGMPYGGPGKRLKLVQWAP